MCGIVGYIGPRQAAGLLLEGLRRLEYRGYDSSGIAVVNGNGLKIMKAAGKLSVLEQELDDADADGTLGIGHTRWATHGAPTTPNAHPHTDQTGRIAVIHNGIIENSNAIRKALEARGHTFKSRDRHRGAGAPGRRVLPGQPRGGGGRGAARRRRRLRPRLHLRRRAGRAGGRAQGLAAARRASARTSSSWPPTPRRCCSTPARSSTSTTARWWCSPATATGCGTSRPRASASR